MLQTPKGQIFPQSDKKEAENYSSLQLKKLKTRTVKYTRLYLTDRPNYHLPLFITSRAKNAADIHGRI